MLETKLNRDMCSEEVFLTGREGWKCLGISEPIRGANYEMTDIILKSAKYAEKGRRGLYTRHAPGEGIKHCWNPNVRYLGSIW